MKQIGLRNASISIGKNLEFSPSEIFFNCSPQLLTKRILNAGQGRMTQNNTLAVETGKFTGRSPKDRFIVVDDITRDQVDWGTVNQPFEVIDYHSIRRKMEAYLNEKSIYVQDVKACAEESHSLKVRLIAERAYSALFAHNMFLRISDNDILDFIPDWQIICCPEFHADPKEDRTMSSNFVLVNFTEKEILIGGTGYTGEIKKSIFSVLNFLLPTEEQVLPMHCSANKDEDGNTTVFFGLSGTGKTTLSSDSGRMLIGDDEHGWSSKGVFNFEGGCYAKVIDLSAEKEPEIFKAIRPGAMLENIVMSDDHTPDYSDTTITQNTRVSYPIYHIDNVAVPSVGNHPKTIFFLTCDAFGVLPPISKLDKAQAMYHFISGYTAKVAGTEAGIDEPTATFSACFGAPFLPLHPIKYAEQLGALIEEHDTQVWLVNTGWTGGSYGMSDRVPLKYTRAMVRAAMNGKLDHVRFQKDEIFNLSIPTFCPHVKSDLLIPRQSWDDRRLYDKKAEKLAELFVANFNNYADFATEEILNGGPLVSANY